nr:probable trehalose-phosphate phosphatase 2 [Leptinotarsa decemlineata]
MLKGFDDYEEYLTEYLNNSSKIALLLDYDGTLSPIVAHPDLAKIPSETKTILHSLSQRPEVFVAIISGRSVSNVKNMVGLNSITYAGNHGMEVLYPDGSTYRHKLPENFEDQVNLLIAKLEKEVVRDGAWIENKGSTLTFHFRATPENLRGEIEQTAQRIIEEANFKVGKAHCALEARPKVDWNKGKVALLLLEKKFGVNWKNDVKVVFAGDDTTDEDAMRELKGAAATFRIAPAVNINTFADKLLSSTGEVVKILKLVERLVKK